MKQRVSVIVRVRPQDDGGDGEAQARRSSRRNSNASSSTIVSIPNSHLQLQSPKGITVHDPMSTSNPFPQQFSYDYALGPHTTNRELFEITCGQALRDAIACNALSADGQNPMTASQEMSASASVSGAGGNGIVPNASMLSMSTSLMGGVSSSGMLPAQRTHCILAYGHTNSGKTHSMIGWDKDEGLAPMAVRWLLEQSAAAAAAERQQQEEQQLTRDPLTADTNAESSIGSSSRQSSLTAHQRYRSARLQRHQTVVGPSPIVASLVEIYNDKVFDLLDSGIERKLRRKTSNSHVFIDGLRRVDIHSVEDWQYYFETALAQRRTKATDHNTRSSRSHAVFTLRLGSFVLCLVDLAGSERQGGSFKAGLSKESIGINQSLSSLSRVIQSLSAAGAKATGFRDSTLTQLLQRYLTGASATTFVACVHPAKSFTSETLHTLNYTRRLKKVQTIRSDHESGAHDRSSSSASTSSVVAELEDELASLREQLAKEQEQAAKVQQAQQRTIDELHAQMMKEHHRRRHSNMSETVEMSTEKSVPSSSSSTSMPNAASRHRDPTTPTEYSLSTRLSAWFRRKASEAKTKWFAQSDAFKVQSDDFFNESFPQRDVVGYVASALPNDEVEDGVSVVLDVPLKAYIESSLSSGMQRGDVASLPSVEQLALAHQCGAELILTALVIGAPPLTDLHPLDNECFGTRQGTATAAGAKKGAFFSSLDEIRVGAVFEVPSHRVDRAPTDGTWQCSCNPLHTIDTVAPYAIAITVNKQGGKESQNLSRRIAIEILLGVDALLKEADNHRLTQLALTLSSSPSSGPRQSHLSTPPRATLDTDDSAGSKKPILSPKLDPVEMVDDLENVDNGTSAAVTPPRTRRSSDDTTTAIPTLASASASPAPLNPSAASTVTQRSTTVREMKDQHTQKSLMREQGIQASSEPSPPSAAVASAAEVKQQPTAAPVAMKSSFERPTNRVTRTVTVREPVSTDPSSAAYLSAGESSTTSSGHHDASSSTSSSRRAAEPQEAAATSHAPPPRKLSPAKVLSARSPTSQDLNTPTERNTSPFSRPPVHPFSGSSPTQAQPVRSVTQRRGAVSPSNTNTTPSPAALQRSTPLEDNEDGRVPGDPTLRPKDRHHHRSSSRSRHDNDHKAKKKKRDPSKDDDDNKDSLPMCGECIIG